MKEFNSKHWHLLIEPDKTAEILKNIKSDCEVCSCLYCKNYIAVRDKIFSKEIISVMKELGIDYKKDIHTSHIAEIEEGIHLYEIDYYFSGEIIPEEPTNKMVDTGSFTYSIKSNLNYRTNEFPGSALVMECYIKIPWVLEEKP